MKSVLFFLPLAALIAFAAYLGLRAGRLPSESEIIDIYAAAYLSMAPEGARSTDCVATPHPSPDVRLEITCTHATGVQTTFLAGPRGGAVDPANLPDAAI